MKKTIFGCTLLIMGAIFASNSFAVAIALWTVGLIFVAFGALP